MPILKNQRHELFCQHLASGLSATAAYIKAGYEGAGPGQSGERLMKKVEVAARIAELRGTVSERLLQNSEFTKSRVMRRLDELSMAAAAVGQNTASIRAEELIGKELGMFVDRADITMRNIEDLSEADIDAYLAQIAKRRAESQETVQ